MAKNGALGHHRVDLASSPTRKRDPRTGQWTHRDTSTGRFADLKRNGGISLKHVRRER